MWIALIQREPDRFEACRHVIEMAQRREAQIWTSAFTLVEVFKRRCGGPNPSQLAEADDKAFEDYIEQDFVERVQVDVAVGTAARRLLRQHPGIKKPQDAIHIATALIYNLDALHTFDRDDLIRFDQKLMKQDRTFLSICRPPHPMDGTLFEKKQEDEASEPSAEKSTG